MAGIKTEADLNKAVWELNEEDCREIVKQIATQWFVMRDGTLDSDKEINSDQLEAVTQALSSRGIYPTE
jgi:ribosomal protein L12E/L44/L45/RPP1/RPP2